MKNITWPEAVRYFALFATWVSLAVGTWPSPQAIVLLMFWLAGQRDRKNRGWKTVPTSPALAIFWCVSVVAVLATSLAMWQWRGAWVVPLLLAVTAFGIAEMLLFIAGATPPVPKIHAAAGTESPSSTVEACSPAA